MIDPIRTCILGAEGAADDSFEDDESENEKQESEVAGFIIVLPW